MLCTVFVLEVYNTCRLNKLFRRKKQHFRISVTTQYWPYNRRTELFGVLPQVDLFFVCITKIFKHFYPVVYISYRSTDDSREIAYHISRIFLFGQHRLSVRHLGMLITNLQVIYICQVLFTIIKTSPIICHIQKRKYVQHSIRYLHVQKEKERRSARYELGPILSTIAILLNPLDFIVYTTFKSKSISSQYSTKRQELQLATLVFL